MGSRHEAAVLVGLCHALRGKEPPGPNSGHIGAQREPDVPPRSLGCARGFYWGNRSLLGGKEVIDRGNLKAKRANSRGKPGRDMRKHEATPAREADLIVTLIHRLLHAL